MGEVFEQMQLAGSTYEQEGVSVRSWIAVDRIAVVWPCHLD